VSKDQGNIMITLIFINYDKLKRFTIENIKKKKKKKVKEKKKEKRVRQCSIA